MNQHRTKDGVEGIIHNTIGSRFSRVDSAEICSVPLFKLLGYTADTETSMNILEGTSKPPTGTDPVTIIILNTIARI